MESRSGPLRAPVLVHLNPGGKTSPIVKDGTAPGTSSVSREANVNQGVGGSNPTANNTDDHFLLLLEDPGTGMTGMALHFYL